MADVVDKATRSRMMSGIRGKDTRPELILRKAMHGLGFRYRLHVADLPGKPDLVFPKYRAAVMVHGCFWHRHDCKFATTPSSNGAFWATKFEQNVLRDALKLRLLQKKKWRTAIVWECDLRGHDGKDAADKLAAWLRSGSRTIEIPRRKRAMNVHGLRTSSAKVV